VPLHFFLGIHVQRSLSGFFLHQAKYAKDIFDRAGMVNCKPAPTPVSTSSKSSATDVSPAPDGSFYRSIAGTLQYLTLTRPDLTYAVNQAYLHMHVLHDSHWALVKRILRYIRGTTGHGVHIYGSAGVQIKAYSDADWAGCPDTRHSMSGDCIFIGDSLVAWSSKH
jgi:hypothetical protein